MSDKVRPPSTEDYNKIPALIKNELSEKSLFQLATMIREYNEPPTGEVTYAGQYRITGPESSFNAYTGFGFYNTSNIPINVLDTMRRDYQVALGLSIVKYPIVDLGFTINCESPQIKAFIKTVLEHQWYTILKNCTLAFDFGFNAFEKVWDRQTMDIDPGLNQRKIKNREFLVLKKLKPIHPRTVNVRVNELGNFLGISQTGTAVLNGKEIKLGTDKSMMLTYQEEYGNYFGKSRLVGAYESWYWKLITIQFFLRWMERQSILPYKVLYPKGKIKINDTDYATSEIAQNVAKAISSYGNITLPSERDDNGNLRWDVSHIEQSRQNLTLDKIVNVWDIGILKGILIPNTKTSDNIDPEVATEVFLSTLSDLVHNIEEKINNEIITPLVEWNFTPEEKVRCTLNIDDIDFNKRQEMRKLLSKILDVSATFIKNMGALPFKEFPDLRKIYETLDVPYRPVEMFVPKTYDGDGKEVKNQQNINGKGGPEKGEVTPGNESREGRDGTPRDTDKDDESNA